MKFVIVFDHENKLKCIAHYGATKVDDYGYTQLDMDGKAKVFYSNDTGPDPDLEFGDIDPKFRANWEQNIKTVIHTIFTNLREQATIV